MGVVSPTRCWLGRNARLTWGSGYPLLVFDGGPGGLNFGGVVAAVYQRPVYGFPRISVAVLPDVLWDVLFKAVAPSSAGPSLNVCPAM